MAEGVTAGSLPVGWERASLGDVAKFINGYTFDANHWATVGRPIIRIQNLTGTSSAYNYFEGSLDERYLIRPGDILVSWSASLGVFIWRGPEAWLNQHIFRVADIAGEVDPGFLYYLLRHKIADIASHTHGSTMKHVTRRDFLATEIDIPPLLEQHVIAHVLHIVQRAMEQTEQVIAAAQELKRSLMGHLFMYGPVPVQAVAATELQDSDIGCIPARWEAVTLEQVATLQRGFDITKDQQTPGPYPVVSSSGPQSTHATFKVRGPGVVVGRKGSVGSVHFVGGDFWPHDTTLWVKDLHGHSAEFVFRLLERFDFTRYVTGVANPTLNRNHVHPAKVGLPSSEEQAQIVKVLNAVDTKIDAEKQQWDVLEKLFHSLLFNLMTAQIAVDDLTATAA